MATTKTASNYQKSVKRIYIALPITLKNKIDFSVLFSQCLFKFQNNAKYVLFSLTAAELSLDNKNYITCTICKDLVGLVDNAILGNSTIGQVSCKGGFFFRKCDEIFSDLQISKQKIHKTILSLKFKFPANNSIL